MQRLIRSSPIYIASLLLCSFFPWLQVSPAAQGLPYSKNVYSLSRRQTQSACLGIYGVPACAVIGGERYRGVYVSHISSQDKARKAHLRVGDVLLSINGRVVETPADADRILGSEEGDTAKLNVARARGGYLQVGSATMTIDAGDRTGSAIGSTAGGSGQKTYSVEELEDFMFELVNNDRASNGSLAAVRRSHVLDAVARKYAEDMAARGFFGHIDPEGRTPYDRLVAAGVKAQIAENISSYKGFSDHRTEIKKCEQSMMDEDPSDPHNHRGNILNPKRKCVGIGVAVSRTGKVVAVQEFSNDDIP